MANAAATAEARTKGLRGIEGKNVLVTGGSSGIGQAIAVRFAEYGANVAINYLRSPDETRDTEEQVQACTAKVRQMGVRDVLVGGDVSNEDDVVRMVGEAAEGLGGLDILVNNAGIQISRPTEELSSADFDRVLAVNLKGSFMCARESIRHFLAEDKAGSIVNISSVHQIIPKPNYLGYSTSKGGMQNLTRTLALEYAGRGIRVNGVGPGATVRGVADPQRPSRRLHRREPRPRRARRRRRARVRADPHPSEAARRHGRVDVTDRPRLTGGLMEHYDVIIIGTGAGGGTLAHRLASSGKRILLLERGGYLPREPENWDSEEIFGKERYVTTDEWVDKNGERFRPHAQYYVGGNTKFYGAILFRLREQDFGEVRHYGGVSPAWPIDYSELEPYYAEAERLYLVHGQAGEDPTEPPRSGPFPHPAVSHEPRIQQLHDDFLRTRHHPFHLPVGVDLNESDPEAGRCVRCDRFDGFPCLTDGKADAHVLCVRPALEHGNVTLKTNSRAVRLETDRSGLQVSRVVVDRGGVEESFSGDIVVVSCGAANSAALLLRSANDQH